MDTTETSSGAIDHADDEPMITPAPGIEASVSISQLSRVGPTQETHEVPVPRPAVSERAAQTAPPSGAPPLRPGSRVIALVAVIALLFGAIGGGIAGGVAGYALSDIGESSVATSAPQANQPETISNPATTETQRSVSDIVASVNPAVVTIKSTIQGGGFFGQPSGGTGSGFIIDTEGHIVTNNHVVAGADALKVVFADGSEADATLVGADPYQDVAVIKVAVPVLATVAFGDSSELRAGDPVIAIGSALGEFTNTVTNGIVSATDRSLDTGEGYRLGNLIQHNAPISPGNSGGPLVDMNGDVIGMNTAVVRGSVGASAEGLGFAVAGNTVKEIASEIIAQGSAARPYLGISFADAAQSNPAATGIVVQDIVAGSPADQAGLKVGDIITAIDGVTIDSDNPFLNLMFQHKPGDTVELTVTRGNGETLTLTVTLGTRPA